MVFHNLYFFAPPRCATCCDVSCRLADITVMDAWLPELMDREQEGQSLLISRTPYGDGLCQAAGDKHALQLTAIASERVVRSRGKMRLSNRDQRAHLDILKLLGRPVPRYVTDLPRAGLVNYLRALIIRVNIWLSATPRRTRWCGVLIALVAAARLNLKARPGRAMPEPTG